MSTYPKRKIVFAWILFTITIMSNVIQFIIWVVQLPNLPNPYAVVQGLGLSLTVGIVFSVLALLIITRLPDNRIGWLMMIGALGVVNPIPTIMANLPVVPTSLTPELRLLLWFDNWSWIPIVFPIFLIPLHFPNGHPPTQRWNWVNWLAISMGLVFILSAPFNNHLGPINGDWILPNPYGFITDEVWQGPVGTGWFVGLAIIVLSSALSLFVRYKRAQEIERHQIKWVLYAGALFAIIYSLTGVGADTSPLQSVFDFLFIPSILAIPIAMTIAILQYRLWDIDIIIRRTLQYSLLTGLLALVYFGGIVLLQSIFRALTGEASQIAIVISTLGIAALFNPLRLRVQELIDRRFYRKKYDAEIMLQAFAQTVRNETDLDKLTTELAHLTQETMQPVLLSVWTKEARLRGEQVLADNFVDPFGSPKNTQVRTR